MKHYSSFIAISLTVIGAYRPPLDLVYFVVTYMTYDPLSALETDFSTSVSSRCRAGELGCWVDSSLTKMTTQGLEHGRGISGSKSYWDIRKLAWKTLFRETTRINSTLTAIALSFPSYSKSIRDKLGQVFEISVTVPAIQLPVLLQGARGSGKASAVKFLASKHGLHVVEVSRLFRPFPGDLQ